MAEKGIGQASSRTKQERIAILFYPCQPSGAQKVSQELAPVANNVIVTGRDSGRPA
jgi:hypothetical protein